MLEENKSREELIRELHELRMSESRYRQIVELMQEGIWSFNVNLKTTFVNPHMARMLGYTVDEMLGRHLFDFMDERSTSILKANVRDRIVGIKGANDLELIKKDGTRISVMVNVAPINDKNGRLPEMIASMVDITDRKHTEEALKAAKADAELYVDLMCHDINNMSQITMGFLELAYNIMEYEQRLGIDHIDLLDKAMESSRNSSKLIENVRKLQREKMGLYVRENIDVGKLLDEVSGQYKNIPNRDIKINYTPVDGSYVEANELLKDVFMNVIGNAIKHSRDPLTLNILMEKVSDNNKKYLKIMFEDNGPGIPDSAKVSLFNRLSLDSSRARGKGFGLCLIKLLVDDYGGKFFVEDRVKGEHTKGCRFVVMLPAVENNVKGS